MSADVVALMARVDFVYVVLQEMGRVLSRPQADALAQAHRGRSSADAVTLTAGSQQSVAADLVPLLAALRVDR